jgi:hypothetical protein
MTFQMRLERLEGMVADAGRAARKGDALCDRSEQRAAYLRGEGPRPPDPPCPAWFDPAEWESRMRFGRCLDYRMTGKLGAGEYLPEMTEKERREIDGFTEALAAFARDLENAPMNKPPPFA